MFQTTNQFSVLTRSKQKEEIQFCVDSLRVGKFTKLQTGEVWLKKDIHPSNDVLSNTYGP